MTTYQRLKAENAELKEDIYKILECDFDTILRYKLKKTLNDAVWFGQVKLENQMQGVFHQIRN